MKQLEHAKRVDIVWDIHKNDSLKKGTREKKGKRTCRRILLSTTIPTDWHSFLDENKVELFHLLAEQIASLQLENREIYTSVEKNVLHSGSNRNDLPIVEPCTHEETDTRMMLHVKDAAVCGHQRVIIRTIDTDIVTLAISILYIIPDLELWLAFGTRISYI